MIVGVILLCNVLNTADCMHVTIPYMYETTVECYTDLQQVIASRILERTVENRQYIYTDSMCIDWNQIRV
jgi:hypothetical protein